MHHSGLLSISDTCRWPRVTDASYTKWFRTWINVFAGITSLLCDGLEEDAWTKHFPWLPELAKC